MLPEFLIGVTFLLWTIWSEVSVNNKKLKHFQCLSCVRILSVSHCYTVQWYPVAGFHHHVMERRRGPHIYRERRCSFPVTMASVSRDQQYARARRMASGLERRLPAWFPVWINYEISLVQWFKLHKSSVVWVSVFEHACVCQCVCHLIHRISCELKYKKKRKRKK